MEKSRYHNFAKRFQQIIDENARDLGQNELADLLGTAQSTISRAKNGTNLPPDSVMFKIKDLWGVDMIDEVRSLRVESRYKPAVKNSPKKSLNEGVPYFDVDFVGGFDMLVNDQTTVPAYLINFKPFERATCWCNITGHSMEPEIHHGDIIALRRIDDISFLPFGEIYAIVARNDMRTVKRLGPGKTKDTYTLIPSNPDYFQQEINKADILYVYEVMGAMKRF